MRNVAIFYKRVVSPVIDWRTKDVTHKQYKFLTEILGYTREEVLRMNRGGASDKISEHMEELRDYLYSCMGEDDWGDRN